MLFIVFSIKSILFELFTKNRLKTSIFFDENLILSIANNSKSISFTKKMQGTFFAQNQFFYRFLWSKYKKKFPSPKWGGNHPQGESALWHNIDFDPWAIPCLLSKFQVNRCILKKLPGKTFGSWTIIDYWLLPSKYNFNRYRNIK